MKFVARHHNFQLPTKGSPAAAGYDIYMPEPGQIFGRTTVMVGLGFAAKVPDGHVALLLPRSGWGSKGLDLMNTCGVIDSDYTGEWKAKLRDKTAMGIEWNVGERLLQFLVVPVLSIVPELVDSLDETERGAGGFGSTSK